MKIHGLIRPAIYKANFNTYVSTVTAAIAIPPNKKTGAENNVKNSKITIWIAVFV